MQKDTVRLHTRRYGEIACIPVLVELLDDPPPPPLGGGIGRYSEIACKERQCDCMQGETVRLHAYLCRDAPDLVEVLRALGVEDNGDLARVRILAARLRRREKARHRFGWREQAGEGARR